MSLADTVTVMAQRWNISSYFYTWIYFHHNQNHRLPLSFCLSQEHLFTAIRNIIQKVPQHPNKKTKKQKTNKEKKEGIKKKKVIDWLWKNEMGNQF